MKFRYCYLIILFAGQISCGQNEQKEVNMEVSSKPSKEITTITEKLDPSTYEILATNHNSIIENFHVMLMTKKFNKVTLQEFVDKFRQKYCTKNCNIFVYDDNGIKPLVKKYPLADEEYQEVADHFIASSIFDMTDVWLYPYQDFKYRELGGTNWKKEVIK